MPNYSLQQVTVKSMQVLQKEWIWSIFRQRAPSKWIPPTTPSPLSTSIHTIMNQTLSRTLWANMNLQPMGPLPKAWTAEELFWETTVIKSGCLLLRNRSYTKESLLTFKTKLKRSKDCRRSPCLFLTWERILNNRSKLTSLNVRLLPT